jgi:hypothetical protein
MGDLMDESKARTSRLHRVALAPCVEFLEGRRLLAAGAARIGIQERVSNGATELFIAGTNRADFIQINDNGSSTAGNITVSFADGSTYTSQGAISQIVVVGKGGNDQVSYNLTGTLVAARIVQVDLGAGSDQFTANVSGAIMNADGLDLEAYGDGGNDNLAIIQTGPILAGNFLPYLEGDAGNDTLTYSGTGAIAGGASSMPALSGGAGNDTITSTYSGTIIGNYIYNLSIDGGAGNDIITDNVAVGAGSTGTVGTDATTPAVVEGGPGNDQIRFAVVVDPTATAAQVNAVAIGDRGKDTVQRSASVQGDPSNESDALLS